MQVTLPVRGIAFPDPFWLLIVVSVLIHTYGDQVAQTLLQNLLI